MKKIFIAIMCLIGLTVSYSCAGNYENARSAYLTGDYKTAYKLTSVEAKKGNADAQEVFGEFYDYGKGVLQDKTRLLNGIGLRRNREMLWLTPEDRNGFPMAKSERCGIIQHETVNSKA